MSCYTLVLSNPLFRPSARLVIRANARLFSTAPSRAQPAGKVPDHESYILLHTHQPPSQYPPHLKTPLWRKLKLEAGSWGGLVNFSWSPTQPVHPRYAGLGEDHAGEELYYATAFSVDRAPLYIPEVSLANLDTVVGQLRAHAQSSQLAPETEEGQMDEASEAAARLHLYVCTHGPRDCRCGETGGEVAKALHNEITKRDLWDRVSLGEVAHVGGHKFAANILVYPLGDWLGSVQPEDVPQILSEILARHDELSATQTSGSPTAPASPLCPPFWRGRMGLYKDAQIELAARS
ncbi:Sucrase/ferredoxin-like-domain-containing protein [Rhodofomes roseus]|uniref:Sucrase/ferredoxin-like-domain-containing protein n=1 Tax=Rhodofomes roseus TaxID=34475 RepID=A0ABQ8JXN0_9APHY|nr:Sucrase/ferredoxin-like-domain-containing protein [Rhodofomes roseus]KAH9828771.1 Sucrase/ferredoxin-like-domain-containing protein [Rhodofomes roseus]